ncbi:MAG: LAGLIDADG family homing endonuclease [Nanoarchaeota archaeon]
MEASKDLALFLGMLCGDGWLSLVTRGDGYHNHKVCFCNTDVVVINNFKDLFFKIFGAKINTYIRKRPLRKKIFELSSYSREVFSKIKEMGFPIGVKRDVLRIPEIVRNGSNQEKLTFIFGLYLTDGCLKKDNFIHFHSGSKLLLEDVSEIVNELFKDKRVVKSYIQQQKYTSYQLGLNKEETRMILSCAHIA